MQHLFWFKEREEDRQGDSTKLSFSYLVAGFMVGCVVGCVVSSVVDFQFQVQMSIYNLYLWTERS